MDSAIIYSAIINSLIILALWLFYIFPWKHYRLDVLKENLFTLKDSLSGLSANKKISLNDPVYVFLRDLIDMTTEVCSSLNALMVLGFFYVSKKNLNMSFKEYGEAEDAKWKKSIEKFDEETSAKLSKIREDYVKAFISYFMTTSILFCLLVFIGLVTFRVRANNYPVLISKLVSRHA